MCLAVPFGLTEEPVASENAARLLNSKQITSSLSEVRGFIDRGNLVEAKTKCKDLLAHKLAPEDLRRVHSELYQLNVQLIFSQTSTPDSIQYIVQQGDTLQKIAKKHKTTIELLKKSNSIESDRIYSGMKLKVSTANYTILVDKSENLLKLFSGDELLKAYPVATGEGTKTPAGTFTIETKLENPTWFSPAGIAIPPGSPENLLGTRWMGFSIPSYGIHGTTDPGSIGTHVTHGCVRMHNEDVEELYSIVPLKTQVTIVE